MPVFDYVQASSMPQDGLSVGFLTFDRDRSEVTGSSRIRAYNLINRCGNFYSFQVGTRYDAVVFQKYYWPEYAALYPGIKVMDICDPDWLSGSPGVEVVRLLRLMDGVVTNTPQTAEYMAKLTDLPIRVIEDRHDMSLMKQKKSHKGKAKSVIWFGYHQNVGALKPYVPKLLQLGLELTIMTDKYVTVCGKTMTEFKPYEHYVKFPTNIAEANDIMVRHDFAVLPPSRALRDQYKSNNRTTHAWSVGLPVARFNDEIEQFMDADARQADVDEHYELAHREYDCELSVKQWQDFVAELAQIRANRGQQVQ